MNYRLTQLLARKALDSDNVETININTNDPISAILIQYKATNNSDTPTAHPAKNITKIELIDGSDVLFSMSGIECQALNYYQRGMPNLNILEYSNNIMAVSTFWIMFGRKLYDKELAFNPALYKNPQLKITSDLDGGGSAPDAGNLEVVAYIFEDKAISPVGMLLSKEHYAYSLTSGAYEYVDLPVDKDLRRLIVMSLSPDKMPHDQFAELRLSEDNDKRVPFDDLVMDLAKYIAAGYPPYVEQIGGTLTTGMVRFFITPTYETCIAMISDNGVAGYATVQTPYGGQFDVKANTAIAAGGIVYGYLPHGAIPIDFGDSMDMDDWYKVAGLKSLELRLKGGGSVGSSSTLEILTEQLLRY